MLIWARSTNWLGRGFERCCCYGTGAATVARLSDICAERSATDDQPFAIVRVRTEVQAGVPRLPASPARSA
jgi:hypothetical protein